VDETVALALAPVRPATDVSVDSAVTLNGITKRFGATEALSGLDLTVATGTICGVLGPNGAGKTTAVNILTTLLRPDGGRATVAGFDVVRQADEVRYRIGLAGQNAAVDEKLTGRDNLIMFARLYHLNRRTAVERAAELLDRFALTDAADRVVKTYSGGMRRRLDLAASLAISPPVLFLDEPTTGLDPRSRNAVWQAIRALVADGTTVLLTTQYLDEADQLADNIAVIDTGKVIAAGTSAELKSLIGGDHIDVVLTDSADLAAAVDAVRRVTGEDPSVRAEIRQISVPASVGLVARIVRGLDSAAVDLVDIAVRRPTLDDVFLQLTGHTTGVSQ
jgi:ABC-2 type transport system ATP-binding protein